MSETPPVKGMLPLLVLMVMIPYSYAVPAEGPTVLSDAELDRVVAGVLVDGSASATALGTSTLTSTTTITTVLDSGNYASGTGFADALACCGTYVYTSASVDTYADGSVSGTVQHSSTVNTGVYSQSTAFGSTYSVNPGYQVYY